MVAVAPLVFGSLWTRTAVPTKSPLKWQFVAAQRVQFQLPSGDCAIRCPICPPNLSRGCFQLVYSTFLWRWRLSDWDRGELRHGEAFVTGQYAELSGTGKTTPHNSYCYHQSSGHSVLRFPFSRNLAPTDLTSAVASYFPGRSTTSSFTTTTVSPLTT